MSIRLTPRTHLAAAWSRVPEAQRGEYIMALNRLTVGVAVLVALTFFGRRLQLQHGLAAVLGWIACGLALFWHLRARPIHCTLRRGVAIVLDIGGVTTMLAAGGEASAFFYIVYLWVIIGNGVRFGGRYILAATVASLVGFVLAIHLNSFWLAHPTLSNGLLAGIAVLPGYLFVLVRQLAEARRQAVEANRAKSLFLASVSHELRTPLTSILGTAELLLATRLDPQQADMVATINAAAEGQLSLVQDVLQFSRIEAGHATSDVASFNVAELLRVVRAVVAAGARKKGLLINAYVTARTPLLLLGDERHLREVLLNLCENAIKFTAFGSITLAADGVDLGGGKVRLRLEVMDTGIGIAPEAQSLIFQLFTQANATIVNRFGGTGLGLALCERRVRLMGGTIGVESLVDAGSTFWVTLDLARDRVDHMAAPTASVVASSVDDGWLRSMRQKLAPFAPEGTQGACVAFVQEGNWGVHLPEADVFIQVVEDRVCDLPARPVRERFSTTVSQYGSIEELENAVRIATALAPPGVTGVVPSPSARPVRQLCGLRVLVADDNSVNRAIVAKMLESSDARIVFAANGEQALEIMSAGMVDVALLDVNMPVMDGIEAAQLYDLAVQGRRRIPIIALTAASGPDIRARCLKAGMDECLVKPIRMADLIETVWQFVSRDNIAPQPAPAPAEAPPAAEIIDTRILRDLQSLGGTHFVENLIVEFTQDGLRVLDELEADFLMRDVHGFRAAAHAMRSIAANIGANGLRDACARWEVVCEADLDREGTGLVARLRRLWNETVNAFDAYVKGAVIRQD